MSGPKIMALFQKRIEGDDSLLQLARLCFQQANLGTEVYAGSCGELDWMLGFKPDPRCPVVVHLPRNLDLFEEDSLERIAYMGKHYAGQLYGLVIHDQPDVSTRLNDYLLKVREIGLRLEKVKGSPILFIEYAAGLDLELFIRLFGLIRDITNVSACIDVGHVGIQQVRRRYRLQAHTQEDVCALNPDHPGLAQLMGDIEQAVDSALPTVINVINSLGALAKPLHFHLHDGHPLSRSSPFGVSDHLSFLEDIPIGSEYKGRRSLAPMFGPDGLARIVFETLRVVDPKNLSFTLEIHPTMAGLPLEKYDYLFGHWSDKTNAERMNHWLSLLVLNSQLLIQTLKAKSAVS